MEKLFEIKGRLAAFYTKYSRYINRLIRFLVALLTFTFINNTIGFSSIVSNPLVTVVVAVICTFLPAVITMIYAIVAVLLNLYTVSLGIAIVSALIFLVMYALYLRYVPGKSAVVLCVLIANMLQVPVLVPITLGLVGGPVYIIAVSLGTIFFYMLDYVKSYATLIGTVAETGLMEQLTAYATQLLSNKIMWVTIISYGLVLLIVYYLRKLEVDHSWKVAIIAGALINIIVMALANVMMDVSVAYGPLVISSLASVLIALVIELALFSVDYSRTEYLQFEDDEYYYYVKAVPKVRVAIPEKTVKRINERQEKEVDKEVAKESTPEPEKSTTEEDAEIQKIIDDELKQS